MGKRSVASVLGDPDGGAGEPSCSVVLIVVASSSSSLWMTLSREPIPYSTHVAQVYLYPQTEHLGGHESMRLRGMGSDIIKESGEEELEDEEIDMVETRKGSKIEYQREVGIGLIASWTVTRPD